MYIEKLEGYKKHTSTECKEYKVHRGYLQDNGSDEKPNERHELTNRNKPPVGNGEVEEFRMMERFEKIVDTAKCAFYGSTHVVKVI